MSEHRCDKEKIIGSLTADQNNFRKWQESQNGTLDKLADDYSEIRSQVAVIAETIKEKPSIREIIVWTSIIFSILITILELVLHNVGG